MPTELDRKFDAVLAAVTGPGGRRRDRARTRKGRAIVANFPATLPTVLQDILRAERRESRRSSPATSG